MSSTLIDTILISNKDEMKINTRKIEGYASGKIGYEVWETLP